MNSISDSGEPDPRMTPVVRLSTRRASEWSMASGRDIEQALKAAESLLHGALERRRHYENRRFAILTGIGGTILTVIASLFWALGSLMENPVALFALIPPVIIILSLVAALIRLSADSSSVLEVGIASELAGRVDAVMLEVAEREKWSYFRIETVRLRLSAFPLDSSIQRDR